MTTATAPTYATKRAEEVAKELGVSDEQLGDVEASSKNGLTVEDVRNAAGGSSSDESSDVVVIAHGRAPLSSGSDGPQVADLARRLEQLGYTTSFSRGENHFS